MQTSVLISVQTICCVYTYPFERERDSRLPAIVRNCCNWASTVFILQLFTAQHKRCSFKKWSNNFNSSMNMWVCVATLARCTHLLAQTCRSYWVQPIQLFVMPLSVLCGGHTAPSRPLCISMLLYYCTSSELQFHRSLFHLQMH